MGLRHLLMAAWLLGTPAAAQEVTFYRCTDANGGLTVQNMPCPKGSKQQTRVMQGVSSATLPAPAPAPARPPPAAPVAPAPVVETPETPAVAEQAPRLPPPVLFQCTTYDKDSYITESAEPQSRCVALRTVGLDGNPHTGAGEACEVIQDLCAQVPDGALCEAWKKRRDQAEVAWRFARPENAEKNRTEFERAQRIYQESDCGG